MNLPETNKLVDGVTLMTIFKKKRGKVLLKSVLIFSHLLVCYYKCIEIAGLLLNYKNHLLQ
jgi:hypothetical protein